MTQAQAAKRMSAQAPAVARLERALTTGKHLPSVATLRKSVKACGTANMPSDSNRWKEFKERTRMIKLI